jgi:hypothetical protein
MSKLALNRGELHETADASHSEAKPSGMPERAERYFAAIKPQDRRFSFGPLKQVFGEVFSRKKEQI